MTEMIARETTVAIAPPGTRTDTNTGVTLPQQPYGFICDCVDDNGDSCFAEFSTIRALVTHQRRTQSGNHQQRFHVNSLVATNMCPFCYSPFSFWMTACQHLRIAYQRNCCKTDCAFMHQGVEEKSNIDCQVCGEICEIHIYIYTHARHIRTHVTPPQHISLNTHHHRPTTHPHNKNHNDDNDINTLLNKITANTARHFGSTTRNLAPVPSPPPPDVPQSPVHRVRKASKEDPRLRGGRPGRPIGSGNRRNCRLGSQRPESRYGRLRRATP